MSTENREMKIHSLTLKNFRGFEDATLDLDRPLTVLFGVNGAGKTSLLDALEIATSHVVAAALGENRRAQAIEDRDIRFGQDSCQIEFRAKDVELSISHPLEQATFRAPQALLPGTTPPLTIVLHVDRSILKTPIPPASGSRMWARGTVVSPHPAWDDAINTDFTSFEHFEMWFRQQEDLENQDRVRTKNLEHSNPGLTAVRHAVERVLQTYSDIHIDRARPLAHDRTQIVLNKEGQEVGGDQLSDGERSLLVIASTVARRLALLDHNGEDSLLREAVVVIDEVELHLHPDWQRRVLASLRSTFPNCQLIVTTHSPQVLSEVPNDAVVLVKDFQFFRPAAPTEGRDTNSILWEVLEVPARPAQTVAELEAITGLLDDGKSSEARERLDLLAKALTERDPEVGRLRSLLDVTERLDANDPEGA